MANENGSTFSFTLPQWSTNGAGKISYGAVTREALEYTASRLQDQADYLRKVAECQDLAEAMKCQLEFAQQSWSRCFGEAWKMLEHLGTQSSSGRS